MPINVWIGGTDTDFNVDANWSTGTAPADGDDLVFNHLAQRDCLLNLTQAAEAYGTVTATSGFVRNLGASGAALTPANGITTLNWQASGGVCYIDSEIDNVYVNSTNQNANALVLDSATAGEDYTTVTVLNGNVTFAATSTFVSGGTITVSGGKVTLNSGMTLTGVTVYVDGTGYVYTSAAVPTIRVSGGTFVLASTSTATTVECNGGEFQWEGTGTITTARVKAGGRFRSTVDLAKTITTGYAHTGGTVDLSLGTQVVETNGWYWHGSPTFMYPAGSLIQKQ